MHKPTSNTQHTEERKFAHSKRVYGVMLFVCIGVAVALGVETIHEFAAPAFAEAAVALIFRLFDEEV
jgi:hypothetical protein